MKQWCPQCGKPYVSGGKCRACGTPTGPRAPRQVPGLDVDGQAGDLWDSGLPVSSVPQAAEYMALRGVKPEVLEVLACRYVWHKGPRVFFPLYLDRKVRGVHGRLIPPPIYPLSYLGKTLNMHPEQAPPPPMHQDGGEGENPTQEQHPLSVGRSPCLACPAAFDPPAGVTSSIPAGSGLSRKYWTVGRDGVWYPEGMFKPTRLFVCEGIFDALYFWPEGAAICAPLEEPSDIRTLLALQPGRIILVGDNDDTSDLDARARLWRKQDRSMPLEKLLPPPGFKDFGAVMEGDRRE